MNAPTASSIKDAISEKVERVTRGPSGKTSSTKSFFWFFSGVIFTLWLLIIGAILVTRFGLFGIETELEWQDVEGAMTWGRDFVFLSFLPYLGNRIGDAIAKREATE